MAAEFRRIDKSRVCPSVSFGVVVVVVIVVVQWLFVAAFLGSLHLASLSGASANCYGLGAARLFSGLFAAGQLQ